MQQFKRLSRGGRRGKQDIAAIADALVDVDENERAVSFNSLPSKYMSEEKASRAVCSLLLVVISFYCLDYLKVEILFKLDIFTLK